MATVENLIADDKTEKTANTAATVDKKELFEQLYKDNTEKRKKECEINIIKEMKGYFKNENEAAEYVAKNIERKKRNLIVKRVRLWRKVNLQKWHYFSTFTYDDKKHSEDTFRSSLSNCLKHLSSRKRWKYVGVWERSPDKKRLHFHSLLHVPNGAMKGELIQKSDYNTIDHRRQITYQNTYFNEKYGRTDFEPINKNEIGNVVGYLIKYIEKTGERIVYSKNLPQYFLSDITEDDIVCTIGIEDRKLLLFDNFKCWDEGCLMGEVSPETIEQMPKSN